jgi:branched-chain amino acid transport system permease protein
MTVVWAGLAVGALYALVATLFNLCMAQTGVFNFAAPQMVMVGAFVTYELYGVLHLWYPLVVILSVLAGAVAGALVELLAVRFIPGGGHTVLVTTVGASFLIEGLAFVRYDTNAYTVPFVVRDKVLSVLGGRISIVDIVLVILAVAVTTAAAVVSRRTRWGLNGRAATMDRQAAAIRGVNVRLNQTSAFAVAGAIGGLVGVLAGAKIHASFDVGTALVVYAFVAFALGGIGSYWGCLIGGIAVGMLQAFTTRYVNGSAALIITFGLLLVVLLVRPTGLFGLARLREV